MKKIPVNEPPYIWGLALCGGGLRKTRHKKISFGELHGCAASEKLYLVPSAEYQTEL